jgi:hypothetical protein
MIDINNIFQSLFRFLFDLGAVFYLVFAVVVVKQVTTMTKNVYDKFNAILVSFSYLHLIFAIAFLLLTFILTL